MVWIRSACKSALSKKLFIFQNRPKRYGVKAISRERILVKKALFSQKSELLENFDEIPLNRSVPIGLEILLGISSNNFRFFGILGILSNNLTI